MAFASRILILDGLQGNAEQDEVTCIILVSEKAKYFLFFVCLNYKCLLSI